MCVKRLKPVDHGFIPGKVLGHREKKKASIIPNSFILHLNITFNCVHQIMLASFILLVDLTNLAAS